MDLGLRNRVTLVTASSRGIGLGIARVFAQEGARIIISARRDDELAKAREIITKESGAEVLAVKADLTVRDDIDKLVKEAMSTFGNIDVLVFNAGPPKPGTFSQLSEDDWEYATRLLLLSAVWLTRRVINNMVSRGWGRLIYVTSLTLRQPVPNLVLSNTVRLSLAGLVKSLAVEYGPHGITANGIMQGYIMTERITQLAQEEARARSVSVDEVIKAWSKEIPAGRYGKPEEIGYLVAFLASDKAAYINGSMILIDGGYVKCVF
ncbi:SDR family oxidoreductase [Vulcanisaeta souniana]|uniref:Short-chain dehydrogenase n=1 Tax=Vulcanisaeta souniana JCM 11219 TaxID=1293586 RepID=A0A830DZT4_9CREN|nr:SDR family oxidoreductase [Vulcanisaeta souniana]BDR91399.1 short-chain dehydrogenase [Vulcanisaeta souniana JCM 11219]GGI72878.1 short-chain dehydrogenase [Vulcanisaeta souniana JCM 11219]